MRKKNEILVALGAVVGGALGYAGFFWLARQGFYSLILPGGLVGIGAGIFRSQCKVLPVLCGLLALALGLLAEWQFAPFIKDDSLVYFLTHIHELRLVTLIMIGLGGLIGFWIPFRRRQEARRVQAEE